MHVVSKLSSKTFSGQKVSAEKRFDVRSCGHRRVRSDTSVKYPNSVWGLAHLAQSSRAELRIHRERNELQQVWQWQRSVP